MEGGFKVPHIIPQDLLLIQELIGVSLPPVPLQPTAPQAQTEEQKNPDAKDISSSGSEDSDDDAEGEKADASEEEIAADLIPSTITDDDDLGLGGKIESKALSGPSDSDSDSESISSEEEKEQKEGAKHPTQKADADADADDDEDDALLNTTSGTYFQTKHEVQEANITVPDTDEVGPDEVLERVGEVMNILDRVAIVRGLPSEALNRASDRALDSDTLLVFGDRKVMGYIYETFGPTSQPLYQVKFNSAYPLNPERVQEGREVFHVPARSRFVFVNQIKAIKGSDASNMHDEEPADDELEFSDDEQEAAWKSRLKRKRGESRARSVASSRQATPNPSFMRDQELADEGFFSRNAYDEHGPYDIDYSSPGPSSSRPAPIPYDDPYGDAYTAPDIVDPESKAANTATATAESGSGSVESKSSYDHGRRADRGYERSEGYGRGGGRDRNRDRRGRERDSHRDGHRDRGRGRGRGGGGGGGGGGRGPQQRYGNADHSHSQDRNTRSVSPTSLAIARATGQGYPGLESQNQNQNRQYLPQHQDPAGYSPVTGWGYGQQAPYQQQHYGYGMQQQYQHQHHTAYHGHVGYDVNVNMNMNVPGAAPFVQPHINPRFMSAFTMGMPGQHSTSYAQPPPIQMQQHQHYSNSLSQSASTQHGSAPHPGVVPPTGSKWAAASPVQERSSSSLPQANLRTLASKILGEKRRVISHAYVTRVICPSINIGGEVPQFWGTCEDEKASNSAELQSNEVDANKYFEGSLL
ncbi:Gar1/Naf1 RNA binding region-domain-containing protein [Gymnopilus junonius]|uniref:H/ACA ribonucleoprotein complex non-core subunit NAF1 n=1 Tax=Gymnopilus junonius TaxID=109634 RepID=A0A9P5NYY8_GYMJU|nr:Gar1/Naf1 RNA binding region-domain-containing protein [Gymnopilus junonius]